MGRTKGSKNRPKEALQAALEQADKVSPIEKPKRSPGAKKAAKKGAVAASSTASAAAQESSNQHRNLVIMDAATGEIIGPDKSLDLSVSGRKHYSHSFLKTVAQCSAQAYFKATYAPQKMAYALERGSCVHTLLENFAKEGKDPIAALPDMWKHYITDHLHEMTEADQEKAKDGYEQTLTMLKEFVAENQELFESGRVKPSDVEVEFNIEIPLELGDKKFTRMFNGKMDLIVWTADRTKYRILDYKTVSKQPTDLELALDAQFALYQYAATKLYGFPPSHIDFYMMLGVHLCSKRFSSKEHPRDLDKRAKDCKGLNYAFKVPRKTDEQISDLFNAYYAPLVAKYESGLVAKEGRADIRNRCSMCTFFDHCQTVKSFPPPRFV